MIRGLPKRAVALIGAVFLLLNTGGEAFGVLACPCHEEEHHSESWTAHDHEGTVAAAPAHHDADAHACHPSHEPHHRQDEHALAPALSDHLHSSPEEVGESDLAHGSDHGGDACPHTGLCHVPAATPVDDRLAITVAWYAAVVRLSEVAPQTEASPAFHPPFFLPYSLAPPALG